VSQFTSSFQGAGRVGALRRPDPAARGPYLTREGKRLVSPLISFLVLFLGLFASLSSTLAAVVNYDIVYVRQPRYGDNTNTIWPEVFHPARLDPGADLILLHPDGSEELLVAGGNGGVTDPFISFDGQSATITNESQLVLIKNDTNYNEAWPRAVVPWKAVHGTDEPATLPWLPNDGTAHPDLPPGTPYGIVGTSSFYKRESFPGVVPTWSNFYDGLDSFNTSENGQSSNWEYQGSDDGKYAHSEIHAVRIIAMESNSHRSYGPNSGGPSNDGNHFVSHARERLRILGESPLRKFDPNGVPILDPEGNPDTSFMAKIPADTPFSFQMLDKDGLLLSMAQTWHQVRPGEVRNNCGGCHAHSQQRLFIQDTVAGKPAYKPFDLTTMVTLLIKTPGGQPTVKTNPPGAVNVEFLRDIPPVLQRSCVPCHSIINAQGSLVLNDFPSRRRSGLEPAEARAPFQAGARDLSRRNVGATDSRLGVLSRFR
jgi:hypothetical protein